MFKKSIAVMAVLMFCGSTMAQNIEGVNARLDAMGGSGITDDIGWTIDHPASLYKYPNQMQGSVCLMDLPGVGKTYGSIVGITQLSERTFFGVTLNNRMLMQNDFYVRSALFLNSVRMNPSDNAKDYPNLPHLNFNFRVNEGLSLGAGGFIEKSSNSFDGKKKYRFLAVGGDPSDSLRLDYDFSQDVSVSNYCGYVEATVAVGKITLWPQVKIGLPTIGGTTEGTPLTAMKQQMSITPATDSAVQENYNFTYSLSQGQFLKFGSHAWGQVKGTWLIGGIFYSEKKFQFCKKYTRTIELVTPTGSTVSTLESSTGLDSLSPVSDTKAVDWWFAIQPTYKDGLYISPEYNGGIEYNLGHGPKDTDADTLILRQYHNFRLGVEQNVKNLWIFDDVAFRCGVVTAWTGEYDELTPAGADRTSSKETMTWKSYIWGSDYVMKAAKITGGLGFHKGRGTLDISCDLKGWTQFLAGPPVALATLSVDFGKSK